jgi:hypothetical protein
VALNIKDRETDRLVRQLAALTGEGITEAVKVAVRERIEREPPPRCWHSLIQRWRLRTQMPATARPLGRKARFAGPHPAPSMREPP